MSVDNFQSNSDRVNIGMLKEKVVHCISNFQHNEKNQTACDYKTTLYQKRHNVSLYTTQSKYLFLSLFISMLWDKTYTTGTSVGRNAFKNNL